MRTLLFFVLCAGCGSASAESPVDAAVEDTFEAAVDSASTLLDGSIDDDVEETSLPAVDAVPADGPIGDSFGRDLMFVVTDSSRSSWICLHAFVSADVKSATPADSLGPLGVLDDTGTTAIAPLGFGQAVRIRGNAKIDAALSALTFVVSAHTTKPDDCKSAWSTIAASESDWLASPPGTFPKSAPVAWTLGDRVRAYPVGPWKVASPSYGVQLINEGSDAALFELQPRDESGTAIGAPVLLGESGKVARYAAGPVKALALPSSSAFASSDLLVDKTPLSLFGPSLARLAWSKDDGRGTLIVYVGPTTSPTIVLVPWL